MNKIKWLALAIGISIASSSLSWAEMPCQRIFESLMLGSSSGPGKTGLGRRKILSFEFPLDRRDLVELHFREGRAWIRDTSSGEFVRFTSPDALGRQLEMYQTTTPLIVTENHQVYMDPTRSPDLRHDLLIESLEKRTSSKVLFVGNARFEDGKIEWIDIRSGGYLIDIRHFEAAKRFFQERGVVHQAERVEKTKVSSSVSGEAIYTEFLDPWGRVKKWVKVERAAAGEVSRTVTTEFQYEGFKELPSLERRIIQDSQGQVLEDSTRARHVWSDREV